MTLYAVAFVIIPFCLYIHMSGVIPVRRFCKNVCIPTNLILLLKQQTSEPYLSIDELNVIKQFKHNDVLSMTSSLSFTLIYILLSKID